MKLHKNNNLPRKIFSIAMKFLVLFFSGVLVVVLARHHPLSDEYIAEINQKATTWTAGRNFDISQWEHVKRLANSSFLLTSAQKEKLKHKKYNLTGDLIPDFFDSADIWPGCESIREIRDQSNCDASWAFAAVEAMSDRICVYSNATLQTRVSAQDLLTCCGLLCGKNDGCQGGYLYDAWYYWTETGIATGGLYNRTDQGCKAYFLPDCNDHPHKCREYVEAPACVRKCDHDRDDYNYNISLTFGVLDEISWAESTADAQYEMSMHGPVSTTFIVYEDFLSYKSGIYQSTTDVEVGVHSARIVGWGVENGLKYWKVANSWNSRWGENGYFRIVRDWNEGLIEQQILFGLYRF